MAPQLDELDKSLENTEGLRVHVIEKKVPVELDGMDKFINVGVWFLFIIGGVIYMFKKAKAKTYFKQLEQKIYDSLSDFERQVLNLRLTGLEYTAIAKILGRDEKSTDNALSRIKVKVRKILEK